MKYKGNEKPSEELLESLKEVEKGINEECEIETKSEYTVVSIPDKDKLLIFPLDQAVEGIYNIEK